VHLFVARGAVSLTAAESVVELTEGDAARLIEAEAAHLDVRVDAEVLIWTFAR